MYRVSANTWILAMAFYLTDAGYNLGHALAGIFIGQAAARCDAIILDSLLGKKS
jgi:hypothetical protein